MPTRDISLFDSIGCPAEHRCVHLETGNITIVVIAVSRFPRLSVGILIIVNIPSPAIVVAPWSVIWRIHTPLGLRRKWYTVMPCTPTGGRLRQHSCPEGQHF
uniref:Uncharacterized protein n=1 Tax=Cryptomonas curvata TaxID=233186 RepID=A0A7S0M3L0_9CRYP|mmetsp:Transcript_19400/g.40766  ORF Transcript_19400/g.40766 Transcript_19400/m.40766 type:complete len:102 (+) Transcript_19400:67-372(+)